MARDEEVEDLSDLDSTLPKASGVELVPPSDAGKVPWAMPAPTAVGEDPAPAAVLTGVEASKVVAEPAVEDLGPSQVAE
jgi:hypothetical protein